MFSAENVVLGMNVDTEYSIYNPLLHSWIVIENGKILFSSSSPVSLSEFYSNDNVGSEQFAQDLLSLIEDQAGTGEIVDDLMVACTPKEAEAACVFSFKVRKPLQVNTGLEFNHDFRSDTHVIFEVRGHENSVDEYLQNYLHEFPEEHYKTRFVVHDREKTLKTVRILRIMTFD